MAMLGALDKLTMGSELRFSIDTVQITYEVSSLDDIKKIQGMLDENRVQIIKDNDEDWCGKIIKFPAAYTVRFAQ